MRSQIAGLLAAVTGGLILAPSLGFGYITVYNFSDFRVAVDSATQEERTFTFGNAGTSTLSFTGPGMVITGTDAADFSFVGTPDVSPFPSGTLRSITVRWIPSKLGQSMAQVAITTDSSLQPTTSIGLSGFAWDPAEFPTRIAYAAQYYQIHGVNTNTGEFWTISDATTGAGPTLRLISSMVVEDARHILAYDGAPNSPGTSDILRIDVTSGDRTIAVADVDAGVALYDGSEQMAIDRDGRRAFVMLANNKLVEVDLEAGTRTSVTSLTPGVWKGLAYTGQNTLSVITGNTIVDIVSGVQTPRTLTGESVYTGMGRIIAKADGTLFLPESPLPYRVTAANVVERMETAANTKAGPLGAENAVHFDHDPAGFLVAGAQSGLIYRLDEATGERDQIAIIPMTMPSRTTALAIRPSSIDNATRSIPVLSDWHLEADLPGDLRVEFDANSVAGVLTVGFLAQAPSNLPNAYPGTWTITGPASSSYAATIVFPYPEAIADSRGYDLTTATIYRSTDNGTTWSPVATTVDMIDYFLQTASPQSQFSQWAVAFDEPLAVKDWRQH